MTDLSRDLHELLRYAQGGGAPDELLDRVEGPVLRLAEASAKEQIYKRIRALWRQYDYMRPEKRKRRIRTLIGPGCSRSTIHRALGPLSQSCETGNEVTSESP